MKTTVSSKGQIVLPSELRTRDQIHAGQQFEIERVEPGCYLLKRMPATKSIGVVDWLLACPEQGWFEEVPCESTDAL